VITGIAIVITGIAIQSSPVGAGLPE